MIRKLFEATFVVIFIIAASVSPLAAAEKKGKLTSFEEEVNKPQDQTDQQTSSITAQDIAVQTFMEMLMSFFLMGLQQTGIEGFSGLNKELRSEWSPALPIVRAEGAYQYGIGGIHSVSGKAEAGYLIFGVDGEYSRYMENGANQDLSIGGGHLMLRALFARHIQTNLALGAKMVRGGMRKSLFEFGLPFYIFFTNSFILDVLPYLATNKGSNIWDLGGGLSYKYKFAGIRAGYRLMLVGGQKLQGPRVGVFFQW